MLLLSHTKNRRNILVADTVLYRGSYLGTAEFPDMDPMGVETEDTREQMEDKYKERMIAALSALDPELYWVPQTSEICGPEDHDPPFENDPDFVEWWKSTSERIVEELWTA